MIPVFSICVANRIKLPELEKRSEYPLLFKKRNSLAFEHAPDQKFFVYSFGVFVFSGIEQKIANKIIRKFGRALDGPIEKEFTEEYGYETTESVEKDSVEFDLVKTKSMSLNKLSLLADILAQSVAIDYFDSLTDEIVSKFDRVNLELVKRGRLITSPRLLVKTIGVANTIIQASISRLALLDKPELIWEEAELEAFYIGLRKMFELDDRFRILEFKVDYIKNNSTMAMNMISDGRMLLLEIMIVVLFVIDLTLFVYEIISR